MIVILALKIMERQYSRETLIIWELKSEHEEVGGAIEFGSHLSKTIEFAWP